MKDGAAAGAVSVRDARREDRLPEGLLERLARGGADCLRLLQARYLERVSAPEEISVVLLDDEEMTRVHGEFMGDPTPTDVITFPYGAEGEILISVETAQRQAGEYGVGLERELTLYLVHGLLHLCGYEDLTEAGRDEMADLQEDLVAAVLREA